MRISRMTLKPGGRLVEADPATLRIRRSGRATRDRALCRSFPAPRVRRGALAGVYRTSRCAPGEPDWRFARRTFLSVAPPHLSEELVCLRRWLWVLGREFKPRIRTNSVSPGPCSINLLTVDLLRAARISMMCSWEGTDCSPRFPGTTM